MGHQDAVLRPRLSARCRFSQRTFAGTRDNGRDAPIPDLLALTRNEALHPKGALRCSEVLAIEEPSIWQAGSRWASMLSRCPGVIHIWSGTERTRARVKSCLRDTLFNSYSHHNHSGGDGRTEKKETDERIATNSK